MIKRLSPKNQKAFTLIELMIVVAIIGILAAIAIPKFADLVRKSKEGATKGSLGAIRSAMNIYYSDLEGVYPAQLVAMTISSKFLSSIPLAKLPDYHPDSSAENEGCSTCPGGCCALTEAGAWAYDNTYGDPYYSTVLVNCAHTDTKNTVWSQY